MKSVQGRRTIVLEERISGRNQEKVMKRMRVVGRNIGFNDKKLDRRRGNLFNKVLFVQVTSEIHTLVKGSAKERNVSVRQWLTRSIIKSLKDEFRAL